MANAAKNLTTEDSAFMLLMKSRGMSNRAIAVIVSEKRGAHAVDGKEHRRRVVRRDTIRVALKQLRFTPLADLPESELEKLLLNSVYQVAARHSVKFPEGNQ